MMRFTGIEAKDTPFYMPEAWGLLRPAAERGQHFTEEAVRGALLTGELQLWCLFRGEEMAAACLTETAKYPAGMQCSVVLCGGKGMEEWLHPCIGAIEAWAKERGCEFMRIEGRKGWARTLSGYSERSVVLIKDLAHG